MAGWKETYEQLRRRDEVSPLEPGRLVELATCAYLIGRDSDGLAALRRAHQGYVQQHHFREAAGIAAQIASILLSAGDTAQSAGWMARADRLLDDSSEPGPERGYLLLTAARQSVMAGRIAEAEARFAKAAAIGERCEDIDLLSLARQGQGRTLIERGDIKGGLALLDEVMVAVTAGELSTIAAGIVYCSVISACSDLFDFGRAREWTEALTRWCEARPELVPYRGECLVHRAEIMSLQGVWPGALEAAQHACERLSDPPGQPAFGAAVYQVAELHRLRGEVEEAEGAYRRAADLGRSPQPGLALLRVAQGRREDAAAAIGRVLKEARHRRVRAKALGAAVEILLACGDTAGARRAADELVEFAAAIATPFLRATAAWARGAVLLAEGEPTAALAACREAWTLWRELEAPFEAARTQVLIAQSCRALGDKDSAAIEFESACRTFRQLGAALELARVESSGGTPCASSGLTPRELQVLRLVATGRTNRAIADELRISEKTVARHISNIFNKLGVSSRAAATAYAFEHRLVPQAT